MKTTGDDTDRIAALLHPVHQRSPAEIASDGQDRSGLPSPGVIIKHPSSCFQACVLFRGQSPTDPSRRAALTGHECHSADQGAAYNGHPQRHGTAKRCDHLPGKGPGEDILEDTSPLGTKDVSCMKSQGTAALRTILRHHGVVVFFVVMAFVLG